MLPLIIIVSPKDKSLFFKKRIQQENYQEWILVGTFKKKVGYTRNQRLWKTTIIL